MSKSRASLSSLAPALSIRPCTSRIGRGWETSSGLQDMLVLRKQWFLSWGHCRQIPCWLCGISFVVFLLMCSPNGQPECTQIYTYTCVYIYIYHTHPQKFLREPLSMFTKTTQEYPTSQLSQSTISQSLEHKSPA